jgi:thiol-disulfide isomerase/thioredoxin
MKVYIKYFLPVAFTTLMHFADAQIKFTIRGHIDNTGENSANKVSSGDVIVLRFINLQRSDSVLITGDSFVLSGEVPYPSVAMLEYKYGGSLILIDGSSYDYYLRLVKMNDSERQYKPEIKTNSNFFTTWKTFQENKGKLFQKKTTFINLAERTKNSDSILYYKSSIRSVDEEIAKSYKQLAADKRNVYATAYIVPAAPDFSYVGYIDIYNSLPDSVKNTFYGKNFFGRLQASKATKNSEDVRQDVNVPAFVGIDTMTRSVKIDRDFFKKNKYTLIEFWASWCGPCRTVNQDLRQRKDEFRKAKMELLGFSLDMASEPWKQAVAKDKTGWLQLSDLKATESPIVKFLDITSIPTNIIVDSSGKIVKQNIYGKALDEFLKDVL